MNNRKERIAIKNAISDKNWLVEWPLDDISHLRACAAGEGLLGYLNFTVEFVTLGQLIPSNCLSKHIRISNNNRSLLHLDFNPIILLNLVVLRTMASCIVAVVYWFPSVIPRLLRISFMLYILANVMTLVKYSPIFCTPGTLSAHDPCILHCLSLRNLGHVKKATAVPRIGSSKIRRPQSMNYPIVWHGSHVAFVLVHLAKCNRPLECESEQIKTVCSNTKS